jgi:hypothetical protein
MGSFFLPSHIGSFAHASHFSSFPQMESNLLELLRDMRIGVITSTSAPRAEVGAALRHVEQVLAGLKKQYAQCGVWARLLKHGDVEQVGHAHREKEGKKITQAADPRFYINHTITGKNGTRLAKLEMLIPTSGTPFSMPFAVYLSGFLNEPSPPQAVWTCSLIYVSLLANKMAVELGAMWLCDRFAPNLPQFDWKKADHQTCSSPPAYKLLLYYEVILLCQKGLSWRSGRCLLWGGDLSVCEWRYAIKHIPASVP